jgi:hypothetical protein
MGDIFGHFPAKQRRASRQYVCSYCGNRVPSILTPCIRCGADKNEISKKKSCAICGALMIDGICQNYGCEGTYNNGR